MQLAQELIRPLFTAVIGMLMSAICAQTQMSPAIPSPAIQRPDSSVTAPIAKPLPSRQIVLGQIVNSVTCAGDPSQSYALYVPSSYTSTKPWPIIYIFDPMGRGKTPVALYKDVAEKYGFILAASNNSRNFQKDGGALAARAIWKDTHTQWTLDPRRIYFMGFSGGARVATAIAARCENCSVAAVIAHGAGYPFPATDKDRFAYVSLVGDRDFNWPEIMELRRQKEEWPAPYRLWVFAGEHQWAPAAVLDQVVAWLQLKAMQSGTMQRDSGFVDEEFARIQKEAESASQNKNVITEFDAYRSLALDFKGLKDVSQFQTKFAALKSSSELKQALKKQQNSIDQQRDLTHQLSSEIAQIGTDMDAQQAMRTNIVAGIASLKYRADHAKSEDERQVATRAFADLWAQTIEAGQDHLENSKNYGAADFYFQLAQAVTPDEPWPALLLAESAAVQGNKKRAIKELREAIKRGLKNPDTLDGDPHLESLRNDPEFQQLCAELRAKRDSQK
jgi:dienelactone hydrolase